MLRVYIFFTYMSVSDKNPKNDNFSNFEGFELTSEIFIGNMADKNQGKRCFFVLTLQALLKYDFYS